MACLYRDKQKANAFATAPCCPDSHIRLFYQRIITPTRPHHDFVAGPHKKPNTAGAAQQSDSDQHTENTQDTKEHYKSRRDPEATQPQFAIAIPALFHDCSTCLC
jgi:hypothetical protein